MSKDLEKLMEKAADGLTEKTELGEVTNRRFIVGKMLNRLAAGPRKRSISS